MINIKNSLFNIQMNSNRITTVQLRGTIANKNRKFLSLHNHLANEKYLYSYPKVQYKKIKNNYYILGIENKNITILKEILNINKINIENVDYEIKKTGYIFYQPFGVVDRMVEYTFVTPWICFNEKNYELFKEIKTNEEKKELINRMLTGNIISIAKRFNYTIKERLLVQNAINLKPKIIKAKDISFLSFKGKFSVNFEIPDYWGIGKFVSFGYGTVIKDEEMEIAEVIE